MNPGSARRSRLWATLLLGLVYNGMALFAQAPVIRAVRVNRTAVRQYELFELTIDLTGEYANAYDYENIAVGCVFFAPGGRTDTVDGFFMQDYMLNTGNGNLTARGAGHFRVRYAPREAGRWQYQLTCTTKAGSTSGTRESFRCEASTLPGFIRRNETSYLGFDNGAQYIPIGENMG